MANEHGYGHGHGEGYGFPADVSFRFGSGHGYGDGNDGYGKGSHSGSGDAGIRIADIGRFAVVHCAPWPYVRIGCELHSIAYWRANWREIAMKQCWGDIDLVEIFSGASMPL